MSAVEAQQGSNDQGAQTQYEQRGGQSVTHSGQVSGSLGKPFALPNLPFAPDALAPIISAKTLELHHGKHHKAYVDKANELIAAIDDPELQDTVVEHIVVRASRQPELTELFNNAAQAWSHSFFWQCLRPAGGAAPTGLLAERLRSDFGGQEKFLKQFSEAAVSQFGSGWAWLVWECGRLRITKTSNGDMPLVHGQIPLLTLDVWEHAYYLDYQNRRPDYVEAVTKNLLNWDFAAANLERALGKELDKDGGQLCG